MSLDQLGAMLQGPGDDRRVTLREAGTHHVWVKFGPHQELGIDFVDDMRETLRR